MTILRLQTSNWLRRIQMSIWLASCGVMLGMLRQAAWACTSGCPPSGAPTCGNNYTITDQFPCCCTYGTNPNTGCCGYSCYNWTCPDGSASTWEVPQVEIAPASCYNPTGHCQV